MRVLAGLNLQIVSETLRKLGCRRVTLDVDGSVVSTGLKVSWAAAERRLVFSIDGPLVWSVLAAGGNAVNYNWGRA